MIGLLPVVNPFVGVQWLTVPKSPVPYASASWIWVQKPGEPTPTTRAASVGTVHVQREWNLTAKPRKASAWFTADNESELSVNGQKVAKSEEWSKIREVDLTPYLHAGKNLISVTAVNHRGNSDTNPGGLLVAI